MNAKKLRLSVVAPLDCEMKPVSTAIANSDGKSELLTMSGEAVEPPSALICLRSALPPGCLTRD